MVEEQEARHAVFGKRGGDALAPEQGGGHGRYEMKRCHEGHVRRKRPAANAFLPTTADDNQAAGAHVEKGRKGHQPEQGAGQKGEAGGAISSTTQRVTRR